MRRLERTRKPVPAPVNCDTCKSHPKNGGRCCRPCKPLSKWLAYTCCAHSSITAKNFTDIGALRQFQ